MRRALPKSRFETGEGNLASRHDYQKTLIACYMGFVTQAISANYAPLLFLTFRSTYGISLEKIALIPTLFFFTQLITDFVCAKYVDRIGYRTSVVASEALSVIGLVGLAWLPEMLPDPFAGILICVVVYAVGSGLIEVLVSPIVEACPFDNKEGVMSLVHSFYCWGSVAVILLSTAFFAVLGIANWRILTCLWAIVPLYNIYNFAVCPIEHLVEDGESMSISQLFRTPLFWLLALLMVCSGASEISMSQWASAFAEAALGVSKTFGDLAGPCLFAVLMGISRVFYGRRSEQLQLEKYMTACGVLCVICYLMASLVPGPAVGLVACAVTGISVGIMWPGTLSISSKSCPKGGTAMFALLALAGDLGGTLGPLTVGECSALAGDNLRIGFLAAALFPAVLIVGLLAMQKRKQNPGLEQD